MRVEEHETFSLRQTFQYLDELRRGALDVCFLLQPIQDEALMTEQVLRIGLVVVLPEDHRLAARTEVPMRKLANERIVLFPRHFHPGCYDYIVGCCRKAGFFPNLVPRHEPQLYSGATTHRTIASGTEISIVVLPPDLNPAARRCRLQTLAGLHPRPGAGRGLESQQPLPESAGFSRGGSRVWPSGGPGERLASRPQLAQWRWGWMR